VDLLSRKVDAPGGRTWTVSPRWNLRRSPVRLPSAWRRRKKDDGGDGSGFDPTDFLVVGDDLVSSIAIAVIVIVAGLLAWFVIWPLLAIAVELLIVGVLLVAGIVGRIALRRPWIVEAHASDGQALEYAVRGYGAMRRVLGELADQLALGNEKPELPGAVSLLPWR
jgi:hypothetical protein